MATRHELIPKVVKLEPEEHNEQLKQETIIRWREAEKGKVIDNEAMMQWLDS